MKLKSGSFNNLFDRTLSYFGIKNKDLAEVLMCSDDYISKIRRGKRNPRLGNFWELLQAMDYVCPKSLEHYGFLLGGAEYGFTVEELIARLEPEEIVYYLNSGDLKEFSAAINARIRGIPTFRYNYIDQAELGDLYFLSRSLVSRLSKAKKMSLLVENIEDEEDLNQLLLLVSNKVVRNSRKLKQDLIAAGKE